MKSLAASTTLVDGRIQVRMPWKEAGSPKQSNYDIALKSRSRKRVALKLLTRKFKRYWFYLNKSIMVNLNGNYHCKPCSRRKGPQKFDLSLTHLRKVTMVFPLTIILRKVLTSSAVSSMYWQHGESWCIPTITFIIVSCEEVRQVIHRLCINGSD